MTFVSAKGTTLDSQARGNILKALRQTASDKVKTKSPCLEPCLRQLESMLAELPQHSPGKFFFYTFLNVGNFQMCFKFVPTFKKCTKSNQLS